jgi:competence protein ComGF
MIVVLLSSLLAVALIVLQALVFWALLRFVKSFGAYTETMRTNANTLLYVHESNLALHRATMAALEEYRVLKGAPKKVEVA